MNELTTSGNFDDNYWGEKDSQEIKKIHDMVREAAYKRAEAEPKPQKNDEALKKSQNSQDKETPTNHEIPQEEYSFGCWQIMYDGTNNINVILEQWKNVKYIEESIVICISELVITSKENDTNA